MDQAIFDPTAPLSVQLADSVSKGFLDADAQDELLRADAWAQVHWPRLRQQFPQDAVTIVNDESMPEGFATYAGVTSYESESKARQFSPGRAYLTLEPADPLGRQLSLAEYAVELLPPWLGFARAGLGDALGLLQASESEFDKALRELIDKLEKLRAAGKLPDDKLVEVLPPILAGSAAWVGGLISSGKGQENIKLWHVDTGASVSCISKENFTRLAKKGAKPKHEGEVEVQTADGTHKFPKYSGIPMSFGRTGKAGKAELVQCDVPLVVTSSDLLGLDQLKHTGTKLVIDPAGGTVELMAR